MLRHTPTQKQTKNNVHISVFKLRTQEKKVI